MWAPFFFAAAAAAQQPCGKVLDQCTLRHTEDACIEVYQAVNGVLMYCQWYTAFPPAVCVTGGECEAPPTPAPPPAVPTPPPSSWVCSARIAECNTCAACCVDYIDTRGGYCSTCVAEECDFVCNAGVRPCNVCSDCCHGYIPNGEQCNGCVMQSCSGLQPAPPPTPRQCNPDVGCNVCTACCQSYIPNGAACEKCYEEECHPPPTPPPAVPTPVPGMPHEWRCAERGSANLCNTCDACCQDYIPAGEYCDKCVVEQCDFRCNRWTGPGIGALNSEGTKLDEENAYNDTLIGDWAPEDGPVEGCNKVCPACCKTYISNYTMCARCVQERCVPAGDGGGGGAGLLVGNTLLSTQQQ